MDDKFIVYKDNLFSLLGNCSVCGLGCMMSHTVTGTALTVKWHCDTCDESHQWDSQPRINKLHAGNIQLSAAIMFSGAQVTKVLRVLDCMGVATMSRRTFHTQAALYLEPTINHVFQAQRQSLMESSRGESLLLGGDGRCDSPGHCAKYMSYSLMDMKRKKILSMKLIQVIYHTPALSYRLAMQLCNFMMYSNVCYFQSQPVLISI